MALPTNNSRPAIPYVPEQVLPNYDRYESLGQFPPTAQQLDGDLNKMIDLINTLSDEINNVVVGALPGADDPLNANNLMTTDGEGNISWVKASYANLDDGAVTTPKIADAAITPVKIQPQAISTEKLENEAVTTPKINPGAITTGTISDGAVTTAKIANNAVTSNKIPNTSIAGAQLQNQTITNAQIANQTITAAQIANQTITAAQIANQTITGTQIANNTISQAQIDAAFAQSLVPTGCIMPFAAEAAGPNGWLDCTGEAVPRSMYPDLFAVIGTTYGAGDGLTTFNVPDLRGRSMFGFIGNTNNLITISTADKVGLGGKGGEETHVLTTNETPNHNHTVSGVTKWTNPSGGSDTIGGSYISNNETITTSNTGGGHAHNNMPPFILMWFKIKV